jgi:Tfp pilus assembly protein PilE
MRMGAPRRQISLRRGLTLVEMMVSLVCVIILMLAYTQLFSDVGSRVSDARAMIEMTNRMRSVEHRLRADLAGVTCDMTPWQRPEDGAGYFEILEGAAHDLPASPAATDTASTLWDETQWPVLGDYDDTLMFTVRSKEGPFTGRLGFDGNNQPIIAQSDVAEVVWFMRPTMQADGVTQSNPLTYTLYRRAFLVMPTYQGTAIKIPINSFSDVNYDLSVHSDGVGNYVANTLGDLTKRECRIAHDYAIDASTANHFPHKPDATKYLPFGAVFNGTTYKFDPTNPRYRRFGEDVVLTNVLSFDVQVWDPTAPVYMVGNPPVAMVPGDPGFPFPPKTQLLPARKLSDLAGNPQPVKVGAFVDLNWLNVPWDGTPVAVPWNQSVTGGPQIMSPFYSTGHPKSLLVAEFSPPATSTTGPTLATFDPWSYHYEHDGIQQPRGGNNPDAGTNGFDDDGNGIVDDIGERETSPPYPVPLRGIKIRIRCYEPDSRQVHEISIIHSFVPE